MGETKYCGNGEKKNDGWLKASICVEDLKGHGNVSKNGKTYVNLNINIKDQPNQWGKDVSISIDDWKPDPSKQRASPAAPAETAADVPF